MKELKEFIRFHIQNSRFAVLLANAAGYVDYCMERYEHTNRE